MPETFDTHRAIQRAASTPTEADVFIIFHTSQGTIIAEPLWECCLSSEELVQHATSTAMRWADTLSEGEVIANIIDKRNEAVPVK